MTQAVLALDQGSHASRACLFAAHGALLAEHAIAVSTRHTGPARVEQDAEELLGSLRQAAQVAFDQALARHPELRVVAAGLAVQRSSIVCCTRGDGAALGPVLSWQDRRNAGWLQGLASHEPRVRELTGLPLSAHYGASKLRWCLEELPAVRRAASQGVLLAAPLASFLAMRLGGAAPRVDPANAARTLLWDTRSLDWSAELLALFGLQRDWLPASTHTRAAFGTLRLAQHEIELRAVTGDQSAVPFAMGPPDADALYVNLGTGAFIQRPLRHRPATPAPLLGSVLASAPAGALYSLEGTVNGAGSAVQWLCASERCDEATLWTALAGLPAAATLPVFVNGVSGLGSPWWRAQLPSHFLGEGSPVARFAAVLESIVFMIATNARLLAQQAGAPRRLILSGGMSRSGWLCQRLAALLELPVLVQHAEASARGIAVLAAPELAADWLAEPMAAWTAAPDPALQARFRQFVAAMPEAAGTPRIP
jgi:glycerol kinase